MIKENSNLSDSWGIKKLGEVCSFQGGSQPAKSEFVYEKREGYVRFLQIRDFKSDKNITYIPESPKNRYCGDDDILLGRYGASVGKVLTNKTGAYNVAVMKTIPSKKFLFKRYLFFYFTSKDFQNRLEVVSSRSAQNGFSKSDIFDFPILVPPLPQQKQIVATLDKVFAAIDTAKANAEQNLQNAKELFESYLQNVFENKGDDWELKKMSDLFDVKSSKRVHKTDWKGDGVPFYRAREVVKLAQNGTVDNDLFISEELYEEFTKDKGAPKEGDIIISAVGTLGQCYLVKSSDKFYFKDASVLWFENTSSVDTRYIEYAFKSDSIIKQVMNKSMGATVGTLTISRAKIIQIPLPPLPEQKQIVNKLDSISAETKKLEAIYTQKIADLEEMKKSVLQKAFSGQLNTSTS
jgi:type I restriction enzyme, S subunit